MIWRQEVHRNVAPRSLAAVFGQARRRWALIGECVALGYCSQTPELECLMAAVSILTSSGEFEVTSTGGARRRRSAAQEERRILEELWRNVGEEECGKWSVRGFAERGASSFLYTARTRAVSASEWPPGSVYE